MKYIPYTIIAMIALIVFTGGTVDYSGLIAARQQALTIAQGAARAGTNAAGGTAVDGDAFQLAGPTAVQAAQNYLRAAGPAYTGSAAIQGQQIVVTADTTYTTRMSWLIGIDALPAHATASARLIGG